MTARRSPAVLLLVLAHGLTLPSEADAACQRIGTMVACDGVTGDSFITADTVSLTVSPGALVGNIAREETIGNCPLSFPAISVGSGSTVVNRGAVTGTGVCASGIQAGAGSTVTTERFIGTTGALGHGIDAGNGSVVVVSPGAQITTTGQSAFGLYVGDQARVTVAASSSVETAGAGAHAIVAGAGSRIDVMGAVSIRGDLADGIQLVGSGRLSLDGTLVLNGRGGTAVRANGTDLELAVNRAIGAASSDPTSFAGTATAVALAGTRISITVEPAGAIRGQRHAVNVTTTESALIVNRGVLESTTDFGFAASAATVAVQSTPGATTTIDNRGAIRAAGGRPAIAAGDGSDTIINFGAIAGRVSLGGGADTFVMNAGSSLGGPLDMGSGDDQVILNGSGLLETAIINAETLTKSGSGDWSVTSTIQAARSVAIVGGGLVVDGRIDAPLTVVTASGQLSGRGVIAGSLRNESLIDARAGTPLTVTGDFHQTETGSLRVAASASGLSPLAVNGQIVLAGTLDLGFGNRRFRGGETFDLFSVPAGGPPVAGGFQSVVGLTSAFLAQTLVRAGNGTRIQLVIERRPYASAARSRASLDLATALDAALSGAPSALEPLFADLDRRSVAEAALALEALTPALPVAMFAGAEQAARATAATLAQWLDLGPSDGEPGTYRAWGSAGRRSGRGRDAANPESFRFVDAAATAGLDYALPNRTRIGVSLATHDGDVRSLNAIDRGEFDPTGVAVYASHAGSTWRMAGAIHAAKGKASWLRAGLSGPVAGQADIDVTGGFGQLTHATTAGPFILKPSLAVFADHLRMSATREAGTNALDLPAQSRNSLRPQIGMRAISRPGNIHPYLAATASFELADRDAMTAALTGSSATPFSLYGPKPRRAQVSAQAGVNIELGPGLMARLGFDGVINDPLAHRGALAGLSYRW